MPAWYEVAALAGLAGVFFTLVGLPFARLVAPEGLSPLGLAPALGWAVFSTLALPILSLAGLSPVSVRGLGGCAFVGAALWLWRGPRGQRTMTPWPLLLAAGIALLPMMAILPKLAEGGVLLAPPLFDHVKIAIIDAIAREGLPAANPFIGSPPQLAYYYLWHFSAALLASCARVNGWTADAAMTGFTAFASMLLMMALAQALAQGQNGRRWAFPVVALLSLGGSSRTLFEWVAGRDGAHALIPREADVGGWLNQAAWVPQHLASATCVVLAVLLMKRLAEQGGWFSAALLGVVVAAGFQSSAWVGGVAFAIGGSAAGLMLLLCLPRQARPGFPARAGAAAMVAAALIAPFVGAQLAAVASRQGGAPVAPNPYPVFGTMLPEGWRVVLSLPAFWLLLLPFELPAIIPLAAAGVVATLRRTADRSLGALLATAALGCLMVAWLLRSTIDNNDLGWRAMLPPILLLTPFAAAFLSRLADPARAMGQYRFRLTFNRGKITRQNKELEHDRSANLRLTSTGHALTIGVALFGLLCGAPNAAVMLDGYAFGQRPADAAAFVRSRAVWAAVRRHSAPNERVANNPLFMGTATPWPVNISWAVFADRPSCFAGWETVLAYGALPKARLILAQGLFERVFAGHPRDGDIESLAGAFGCRVILVVPGDGAWLDDPFTGSSAYSLVETGQAWRLYRASSP